MRGRRVVVGLLVLVALAGCDGQPGSPPAPSPSAVPPAPTPPPGPDPAAARDVRGFLARPCELLPPERAQGLGLRLDGLVRVGGFDTPPIGCAWFRGEGQELGQVEIVLAGRDLLTEAFRDFLPEPERQLLPTAVAGLPAVTDGPFDGFTRCELTVRTATDQGFAVRVQQVELDPGAACAVARSVAEPVVAALPPRA